MFKMYNVTHVPGTPTRGDTAAPSRTTPQRNRLAPQLTLVPRSLLPSTGSNTMTYTNALALAIFGRPISHRLLGPLKKPAPQPESPVESPPTQPRVRYPNQLVKQFSVVDASTGPLVNDFEKRT